MTDKNIYPIRSVFNARKGIEKGLIYNDNALTERVLLLNQSLFKWENLPDDISINYMERILLQKAEIAFFRDNILNKFLCLEYAGEGPLGIYGYYTNIRAYSNNGWYSKNLKENEFVRIGDNGLRIPLMNSIFQFIDTIKYIDEIININLNAQKTPVIFEGNKNTKLTVENIVDKYQNNVAAMIINNEFMSEPIKAMYTNAPFLVNDLYEYRTKKYNELLNMLGIQNFSNPKKERLISDEVSTDNGLTKAILNQRLYERQQAVALINKKWSLNIKVSLTDSQQDFDNDVKEGGAKNVEVHNKVG